MPRAKKPEATDVPAPAPTEPQAPAPYIPDDREAPVKFCRDCADEVPAAGIEYPRNPLRPIAEFYHTKVKNSRYKGGYRYSAYCIPHQSKRNAAAVQAKRARDRAEGKKLTLSDREKERRRSPTYKAKRKQWDRAYAASHADEIAARYQAWVAEHPQQRKLTQEAWYEREMARAGKRWSRPHGTDERDAEQPPDTNPRSRQPADGRRKKRAEE